MSRISLNRKRVKFKRVFGLRGRLVLLALILVVPLMLERARSLEDTRASQLAAASNEYKNLAKHSAETEREVVSSVEAVLKSSASVYAMGRQAGRPCAIMRASLRVDLPWIRSISITGSDDRVSCSTLPHLVGLDLSDRLYLKQAKATGKFVLSDYIFSRATHQPTVLAALPISAVDSGADGMVIAGMNLSWMSRLMDNLGGRPGISAVLVDRAGIVLAAPHDLASLITRPLADQSLLPAIRAQEKTSGARAGALSHIGIDGRNRTVSFALVPGTRAHLIVTIDKAVVSAGINREIRTAYIQLGFVCILVLLGALIAAEKLIMAPIRAMTAMASRIGSGDRQARAAHGDLPAEFIPLGRALNAMAAQLGQRERALLETNNRLSVMASMDIVSGLANRRGFQSRFDFEWLKAQSEDAELAALMIDVDDFKLFNDTYGHPEGDACLGRIGETLAAIANRNCGFPARYGGEEFCVLLPGFGGTRALEVAETIRRAVADLRITHAVGPYQIVTVSIGVASVRPHPGQRPVELIDAADTALYAAKRQGRNAVFAHGRYEAPDATIARAS